MTSSSPATRFTSPRALREACRSGEFAADTTEHAVGFVQTNLVAVPAEHAGDFLEFCSQNVASCPLLEMTEPGGFEAAKLAPGSDLRKDLGKYYVWRDGVMVEERADVTDLWREDMQAFLLGCSNTWEHALVEAQLTPRHIEEHVTAPMYDTSIRLRGVGPFQGNMIVSMRPYLPEQLGAVTEVTSAYPAAHGTPVHSGDPQAIGVDASLAPHYGDPITLRPGEVPVFWACGVTPQSALRNAKLPLAITHKPGCMFVADVPNEDLKAWRVPGMVQPQSAAEPAPTGTCAAPA